MNTVTAPAELEQLEQLFDMRIPGIPDITVNAGSISGLAHNELVYAYYDDPGLVGGTVVFEATTDKTTALDGAGRFFIGSIQTPAAGGQDTVGNNDGGAGAQSGMLSILSMSISTSGTISYGSGITNPQNATDNDPTTYALLTSNSGGLNQNGLAVVAPPGIIQRSASVTLKIKVGMSQNDLSPATGAYAIYVQYGLQGLDLAGAILNPTLVVSVDGGLGPLSPTIYSISLPPSQNLANVLVQVNSEAGFATVSGAALVQFYGAWIEVTQ